MPKTHSSNTRIPDVISLCGEPTSWSYDQLKAGLLFDIRRAAERTAAAAEATLSVQRRIDRRLAKTIKLR
jgi:hypothetical protein